MALQDIIAFLETCAPDRRIPYGFKHPHSYRGFYDELAFEPAENVTVGAMLEAAKSALGTTYTGYKGGEYTMRDYTPCHLAVYGSTGEELNVATVRAMVSPIITADQIEQFGLLADEIDNLCGAMELPMPPTFHIEQLKKLLPAVSAKIKALVVELSGENPWEE